MKAKMAAMMDKSDAFVCDLTDKELQILYAIQLSFAPGDVGEFREGENINIIRDAVVFTDLINIGISVLVKPNYRKSTACEFFRVFN
jgi:hypothetical protein